MSSTTDPGTWARPFADTAAGTAPSAESGTTREGRTGVDRFIELICVVVLGVATITTAWCGFQSAQWSNRSSELARIASDQHIEAARLFGAAIQRVSYDGSTATAYAAAKADGNTRLLEFYRRTLIREDFLPVLDRWEEEIAAGQAPVRLTEDEEYIDQQFADYRKALAVGDQATQESEAAAETAGDYLGLTIILAMALFFAGVTSSFKFRLPRLLLLTASIITLVLAITRMIGLPIT